EVSLTVNDLTPDCNWESLPELTRKLDLRVKNLTLTPKLFDQLPDELKEIWEDYQPEGLASLTFTCERDPSGGWQRRCVIQPEDLHAVCQHFPYALEHLQGTLEHESGSDRAEILKVNLVGHSGTRPIHIKGDVRGPRGNRAVQVDLWGEDLPLDQKLLD